MSAKPVTLEKAVAATVDRATMIANLRAKAAMIGEPKPKTRAPRASKFEGLKQIITDLRKKNFTLKEIHGFLAENGFKVSYQGLTKYRKEQNIL